MALDYYRYWGKAKRDAEAAGPDYHLLVCHSLDVAAVAEVLFQQRASLLTDIAAFLEIEWQQLRQMLVFSLMLHDLGKFAGAFQNLKAFPETDLKSFPSAKTYHASLARHDKLGLAIFRELLTKRPEKLMAMLGLTQQDVSMLRFRKTIEVLLNTVFGHHGQPINYESSGETDLLLGDYIGGECQQDAEAYLAAVCQFYPVKWPVEQLQNRGWRERLKQVSWHLAGIAVLCDWLGSDAQHFQYQTRIASLADYWQHAQQVAQGILAKTELFQAFNPSDHNTTDSLFGFAPSPLQAWAQQVPIAEGPQLFVLEDLTGAGKTEAALLLAQRLMQVGQADGLYFALPTMATANAMFERLAKHIKNMYAPGQTPSLVLAHGGRKMVQGFKEAVLAMLGVEANYSQEDESTKAVCNQWLADSNKKALLASVGVGTIDQVLMAVLPFKHQSVRVAGLHRKVLIVDEVHAADAHMLELLAAVLTMHTTHGGSAILLSATLTAEQKQKLAQAFQQQMPSEYQHPLPNNSEFPLATQVAFTGIRQSQQLAHRPEVEKDVPVAFVHSEAQCAELLLDKVLNAQGNHEQQYCAVWVRNSVAEALAAYELLRPHFTHPEHCILFHAGFIPEHRQAKEQQVMQALGKGACPEARHGRLIITTQVFQESLDADADFMISDICPIDDLIQRLGRLHRHTRNSQGEYVVNEHKDKVRDARPEPVLYVHAPQWQAQPKKDWLQAHSGNTQAVYGSAAIIWQTMKVLREVQRIRLPEQARLLIESVFGEQSKASIPEVWLGDHQAYLSMERIKANAASHTLLNWNEGYSSEGNNAGLWNNDQLEIGTRYNELEYFSVLLLRRSDSGKLIPWSNHAEYPVEMSVLKLTAKKLEPLALIDSNSEDAQALLRRYPYLTYYRLWLPDEDKQVNYDAEYGVKLR